MPESYMGTGAMRIVPTGCILLVPQSQLLPLFDSCKPDTARFQRVQSR